MLAERIEHAPYRTADEIICVVRGFESCTLQWSAWTHGAHLTIALWYLLHDDFEEALLRVRAGIKRFNRANGVVTTRERGYHETLTVFWLRAVRAFLDESYREAQSLVSLANELIESADKNLPLEYYSRELLFSREARLRFVEPDLKSL